MAKSAIFAPFSLASLRLCYNISMNHLTRKFLCLSFLTCLALPLGLFAQTTQALPNALAPSEVQASDSLFAIDPTLETWFENRAISPLDQISATQVTLKKGELGYRYISAKNDLGIADPFESKDALPKKIKSFEESYLFAMQEDSIDVSSHTRDSTYSCKDLSSLDEKVSKTWLQAATLEDLQAVFLELAAYRPTRKVSALYQRILSTIEQPKRYNIVKKMPIPTSVKSRIVRKDPKIINDFPQWLSYEEVAFAAIGGSCANKKETLLKILNTGHISAIRLLPTLVEGGSCFIGPKGSLSTVTQALEKKGFPSTDLSFLFEAYKSYVSKRKRSPEYLGKLSVWLDDFVANDQVAPAKVATAFFAGRIWEEENEFQKAIKAFSFVAKHKKLLEKEWVRKNMQRLIVLLHREKRFDESAQFAIQYKPYGRNVLSSDNAVGFSKFWLARNKYAVGKKDEAVRLFKALARKHFSSYYGAMAHAALESMQVKVKNDAIQIRQDFSKGWLYSQFSPREKNRLEWIEALISVKDAKAAQCEIELLHPRGRIEGFYAAKAILYHLTGDYLSAIKSLAKLDHYDRNRLPRGIETIFFPLEYRAEIELAAKGAEIDPVLPMSIIRQESVFNPVAVSGAGAVGLMQLMPATAKVERRRLSSAYTGALKLPKTFKRSRLKRSFLQVPKNNIAIGVHHLRSLKNKYQHPVFVMTAYNASPRATKRWQENIPTEDIFFFIESIPYRETQKYVKLVFRNYFYYSQIYYRQQIKKMAMLEPVIEQAFETH